MSEESKTEEPTIETLYPQPEAPVAQLEIDRKAQDEMQKRIEANLAEMEGAANPGETAGGTPASTEPAGETPATQGGEPPAEPAQPDDADAKAKALAEARAAAGRWGAEKQAYEKQLKEMRAELDALKSAGKPAEKAPEKPATAKPEDITDADLDAELDEDWRDNYSRDEAVKALLRERAREERAVAKAEARLNARLESERAEAAKAAEAARAEAEAAAALHDAVRSLVPDADALDADASFQAYLQQPLPGTLGTRMDAAKAAIASAAGGGDAEAAARAVAEIYRGFGAKTAGSGRAETKKAPVPDPSKYQVPATSGKGAAPTAPAAKTFREEELAAWVEQGREKGESEFLRRKRTAIQLRLEGRVTG